MTSRPRREELSDAAVVSRSWGMALATLVSRITGFIRSFTISGTTAVEHLDHGWDLGRVGGLASFGTDGSGELYVVSISGSVYRIVRDG